MIRCPVCGLERDHCPLPYSPIDLPSECLKRIPDRRGNIRAVYAGPLIDDLAGVIEQVRSLQRPAA